MKKAAVLGAFRQELIWLVANLFGTVYYVVETRQFLTPDYALVPNPFTFADTVLPILEFFLIVNLIWTALVIFAIARRRKTANSLLVVLFACILWIGTFLYIRSRISQAIENVQMLELKR